MGLEGLFRKRDIAILVLVIVTVFISLDSPKLNYSLEPAWFIDQKLEKAMMDVGEVYRKVDPIMTDLDGDHKPELLMISKDFKLKECIFDWEIPNLDEGDIYHPNEKNSISLMPEGINEGNLPVAIKAGYVNHYDESKSRQQVIVVLKEDWTVVCFDADLNFKWEKKVARHTHEIDRQIHFYSIEEYSILIAPLALKEEPGSEGIVVIGARMKLRRQANVAIENGSNDHFALGGEVEHPDMHARSKLEHFSVYALDADVGHVLWKHDGMEVRTEQFLRSLPQHAYNLDLKDLMGKSHHAAGMSDWTVFRQSLIDELPHSWHGSMDTSMRIAHFVRRHFGAGVQQTMEKKNLKNSRSDRPYQRKVLSASRSAGSNNKINSNPQTVKAVSSKGRPKSKLGWQLQPLDYVPLAHSANLPHDAAEHTEHPNVVVIHTKTGLEVIALRTGTPLTSLALDAGKAYADLDGDGVVDSISVLHDAQSAVDHERQHGAYSASSKTHELHQCMVVVLSGLPTQSQLFNGSVCSDNRPTLHDTLATPQQQKQRYHVNSKDQKTASSGIPDEISYAAPLILPKLNAKTQTIDTEKDLFIAVNNGFLTSYSGSGRLNWQIRRTPTWQLEKNQGGAAEVSCVIAYDAKFDRVRDSIDEHDNVHAHLLAMGEDKLQLISRDGDLLDSIGLLKKPIMRPILADYNNDGVTDVIIVSDDAILGYQMQVHQATHGVLIALLLLCAAAVVIFVLNVQVVGSVDLAAGVGSGVVNCNASAVRRPASKKNVGIFKVIRSTDDAHLD